jgi:hypothetical protein
LGVRVGILGACPAALHVVHVAEPGDVHLVWG